MQKVKPQCKNQKFSLSAHKAEISGEMHCSLCAFVPLCLCAFAPLCLCALRSKNKKQSQFARVVNWRNVSNNNDLWRFL